MLFCDPIHTSLYQPPPWLLHPSSPPSFYNPQMSTFFEYSPPPPPADYQSSFLLGSVKENCGKRSVPWTALPPPSTRSPLKSLQPTTKNFQCDIKDNHAFSPKFHQPIGRGCQGKNQLNMESIDDNIDAGRNASSPRNTSLQTYNPNMNQRKDPSSEISSPVETRREFMPRQQQHNNHPQPMMGAMHPQMQAGFTLGPPPTKMLVDPSTGQQYFVPTAQPHVAYYPIYYNANVAPQPQPLYYQPTQPSPQGYFMGAHQPIPTSPTHQGSQPMFFHSQDLGNHYMRASSPPNRPTPPNQGFNVNFGTSPNQPYRVEIPPSTAAGSVCEAQSISPTPYFHRNHESRVSTESAASSASNSSRNKHSDDSMSPHTLSAFTAAAQSKIASSLANKQEQQQQKIPNHQSPFMDRHNSSARYSSTTTSSSSGFASGGGETAINENSRRNDSGFCSSRTLAHTWRGESDQQQSNGGDSPRQTRCPTSPKTQHHESPRSAMPNRTLNFDNHLPQAITLQRPLAQKSIRMDIDFKRTQSPEQPKEEEVCAKANTSRAAPPTAFTVQFDAEGNKESIKSLQDAARQAPTGRRLMRKSTGATNSASFSRANEGSGSDSGQDPKHYLFTKMIQGYNKKISAAHGNNGEEQMSLSTSSNDDKRESDALSEAGTYIVEGKNRRGTCMITSQIIDSEDEEDSDSSTATTISDSIPNSAHGAPQRPSTIYPPQSISTTEREQKTPVVKRSLMSDLRKLREENCNKPIPAPRATSTTHSSESSSLSQRFSRVSSSAANVGQSQNPPSRPCHGQRPATSNQAAGSNNLFRRGDGGRFSMRSSNNASSLAKVVNHNKGFLHDSSATKPPFRTGAVGFGMPNYLAKPPTKVNAVPQETPEMIAWLRRKEYDPRKAAAEARKLQQLKQRDAFMSNRSISYHNADGAQFKNWRKPFGDERSNKSHDDLSRLGEETEDFAQLSLAGSSTSLKKTVDELTQKCQKSIELIRLSNKNSLSESVENLLERVVDSNTPCHEAEQFESSENISNRLERLSSAFDAIQKYLEEQSSATSPVNQYQPRPRAASGSSTSRILLNLNTSHISAAKKEAKQEDVGNNTTTKTPSLYVSLN